MTRRLAPLTFRTILTTNMSRQKKLPHDLVQIRIQLPAELHRKAKSFAALAELTWDELIRQALGKMIAGAGRNGKKIKAGDDEPVRSS